VGPDRWEAARAELAAIIEEGLASFEVKIEHPAAAATLTWADLGPGYTFTLQASPALIEPFWAAVAGDWPARTNAWSGAESFAAKFFRVLASPLPSPGR
jgi:hypothetical protein